jgi:hypothetical protein
MIPVVGIFRTLDQARLATERLDALGLPADDVNVLTADSSSRELAAVPTAEAEQPGVGRAIGAVVGGAAGAATGMQLATAAATAFLLPGIGPVLATGVIAGALVGLGAGATIGKAMENVATQGLPRDELFVYEDALRRGRTVLVALLDGEPQAQAVRALLTSVGAESVDAARDDWWVGLREAERLRYAETGGDFARDEAVYRRGFEASLDPRMRGRDFASCREMLREIHPGVADEEAFRRGFEGGQAYQRALPGVFAG